MSGFSAKYLEHFQAPRNVGEVSEPSVLVEVEHEGGGCFDRLRLTAKVEDGVVQDIKFKARACSGTIAASSAATEWATGKNASDIAKVTSDFLADYLDGVPEKKRHSIDLATEALQEIAKKIIEE